MTSWVKLGAKCVCVKGARDRFGWGRLVKGEVYTVANARTVYGDIWLSMAELPLWPGPSFSVSRFRPLVTQADDIAMFTHHLDEVPA